MLPQVQWEEANEPYMNPDKKRRLSEWPYYYLILEQGSLVGIKSLNKNEQERYRLRMLTDSTLKHGEHHEQLL